MTFDNPEILFGLFILIPAAGLALFHYYRRRSLLGLFSMTLAGGIREVRFRYAASFFGFLLFIACLITALAGPRWGTRLVPEPRRGIDVVLAMDLSRSMDVRDAPFPGRGPVSRMIRGAAVARDLVAASPGVRFAVAVGKGSGVLALPLTDDTEAVVNFLESLSGQTITGRGTNLEKLLDAAGSAFQDAFPTRRRIILFSDGESLSGSLNAALDRIKGADAALAALGLGSEEGGAVPAAGGVSGGEISSLRSEVLRAAAERTGGIYVDGNRSDAASVLVNHIAAFSSDAGPGGFRRERYPRWHLFVIAALAALGITKLLEKGYGRKRK